MNTKHTPTPWFVDGLTIESKSGGNIGLLNLARPEAETKANADFIVKACNSHDELLEALQAIQSHLQRGAPPSEGKQLRARMDSAIAKATT